MLQLIKGKPERKSRSSIDTGHLRRQIQQTKEEIDAARNHFEQAVDPILIDCYIYEINAAQLRYQFLLRRFKAAEEAAAARQQTVPSAKSQTSQEVSKHAHLV